LGFQCDCVYTIENGLNLLEYTQYNYIISTLSLPDGDSADFIKKANSANKARVIILSNDTDLHYKEYLYFRGVVDFILDTDSPPSLAYSIYQTILKIETNTQLNKILVIEQSKKICEQIKDILTPRNYIVTLVNDLLQAYELLKMEKYSLIILDINYQNSFGFLYEIKADIDKTLPVIILTDANRSYNVVRDAFKHGASDTLRKPIFAEEFILKVDQFVDYYKTIRGLLHHRELLDSYKKIVDISVIVSKTDAKGNITYANDMFCKISKYTRDELLGKPHNIVRDPSMSQETFKEMWRTIKAKKVWQGVVKNRAKDSSQYIVETSIVPLLNSDGEIEEYISLRTDITALYRGVTS
jgi:PAS domain S-box-containing protein